MKLKPAFKFAMFLAVAIAATASPAQDIRHEGNSWVQTVRGSVAAARSLKLTTGAGSVTVTGTDQREITWVVNKRINGDSEANARRQFDNFSLRASQRGEEVVLEGAGMPARRVSVDIRVNVPHDTSLVKVETMGGTVSATNLHGRLDASSGGGAIHVSDIAGPITARTSGGSIDVRKTSGELKLETAGGGITIRSASGRVYAQTAGGSIDLDTAQSAVLKTAGGCISVKQIAGELDASTAGGSVEVGDVAGPAVLETAGGSIRLNSAKGLVKATTSAGGIRLSRLSQGAVARTAAGPITTEFVAQKGSFSDSTLETTMGDIVVYLPADLPVTVNAMIDAAFGHAIRSDFPELKITSEGGDYGPREIYGRGAINGGGPVLKIRTTSGNIELRRGNR
jgi:DUF4097 and DUF4098 domain-containing protein YvlB